MRRRKSADILILFCTIAVGVQRTSDREPSVMFPHKFNYGPNMTKIDGDVEIVYPAGFDGMTVVSDGNGTTTLPISNALVRLGQNAAGSESK